MNPSPTESKDESDEDRLSDLPDALIHHIFSFMDMSDVVRTSILSNSWKTLWLSTPTLNFSLHLCSNFEDLGKPKCDSCIKRTKGFMDFVDRVLILGKSSNLDKFNLSYMVAEMDIDRLHTWVLAALGKNARNLLLEVYCSSQPILLPHNLFTSNIIVLKLFFYCDSKYPAVLPNSICIALKIKDLQLRSVMLPNGNANGELILSCPVLENLNISHCDLSSIKVFSISTPQLENLEFVYLYNKADIYCQVKTCTPNLKRIKVKVHSSFDNSMLDYCLENVTSLVSTEVGFYSDRSSKKSCSECLIKILTGIHNVRVLYRYYVYFMAFESFVIQPNLIIYLFPILGTGLFFSFDKPLTDFLEALEKLPDMFGNLKFLTLKLESPSVHAAINFLDRFSHIENLV